MSEIIDKFDWIRFFGSFGIVMFVVWMVNLMGAKIYWKAVIPVTLASSVLLQVVEILS